MGEFGGKNVPKLKQWWDREGKILAKAYADLV